MNMQQVMQSLVKVSAKEMMAQKNAVLDKRSAAQKLQALQAKYNNRKG